MDSDTTSVTVSLTGPEVELLDRAIDDLFTRSDFVLLCLPYRLLALADSGDLEVEVEAGIPEFVQWYRELAEKFQKQIKDSLEVNHA